MIEPLIAYSAIACGIVLLVQIAVFLERLSNAVTRISENPNASRDDLAARLLAIEHELCLIRINTDSLYNANDDEEALPPLR